MNKLRCLLGGMKMPWRRVILLSVAVAVAVGALMIPDALDDTSLQNPGATFEFWVLFALVIALNCDTALEAGVKVFVAFVISQPLIYLVQVPFSWRHWELFSYYTRWILPTVLTFPGAMLAWLLKKNTKWNVVILSAANLLLAAHLAFFVKRTVAAFPSMLLSDLFILAEMILFSLLLLPTKTQKILGLAIAAAATVALLPIA